MPASTAAAGGGLTGHAGIGSCHRVEVAAHAEQRGLNGGEISESVGGHGVAWWRVVVVGVGRRGDAPCAARSGTGDGVAVRLEQGDGGRDLVGGERRPGGRCGGQLGGQAPVEPRVGLGQVAE